MNLVLRAGSKSHNLQHLLKTKIVEGILMLWVVMTVIASVNINNLLLNLKDWKICYLQREAQYLFNTYNCSSSKTHCFPFLELLKYMTKCPTKLKTTTRFVFLDRYFMLFINTEYIKSGLPLCHSGVPCTLFCSAKTKSPKYFTIHSCGGFLGSFVSSKPLLSLLFFNLNAEKICFSDSELLRDICERWTPLKVGVKSNKVLVSNSRQFCTWRMCMWCLHWHALSWINEIRTESEYCRN